MIEMLTKEQADMLRKSVKGVRFDSLNGHDADILRWLMAKPREYCAADVRRDLDAIFATQDGLCALASYEHEKIMEKRRRANPWIQVGLVLLGAVLGQVVPQLFALL